MTSSRTAASPNLSALLVAAHGEAAADEILQTAIGWNQSAWINTLNSLTEASFDAATHHRVIEIGASRHSCVGLAFAALGCDVVIAYYDEAENPTSHFSDFIDRFGLADHVTILQHDLLSGVDIGLHDVAIVKSVLGGLSRDGADQSLVDACRRLTALLRPGGVALVLENAAGTPVHKWLRTRFGAGRNSWNYLDGSQVDRVRGQFNSDVRVSHGFAAFADTGVAAANRLLGWADAALLDRVVPGRFRVVYGFTLRPEEPV